MSDTYSDPFAQPPQPQEPQVQPQQRDLGKEWSDFLADPKGRATLLNFGISLMQPVPRGQTPIGHLGAAVGQAGAALSAQEESDTKQKLREAQTGLAEQRASLAGERAANVGTAANLAQQKFELAQEIQRAKVGLLGDVTEIKRQLAEAKVAGDSVRQEALLRQLDFKQQQIDQMDRRLAQGDVRLQQGAVGLGIRAAGVTAGVERGQAGATARARALYDKQYDPLTYDPKTQGPKPGFEEWLAKPENQGLVPKGAGALELPAPRTQGRSGIQNIQGMSEYPEAPLNPSDREDGGVYTNQRGQVGRWNAGTQTWQIL